MHMLTNMKCYLLIFTLLLSFLANGVAGASMVCVQPVEAGHTGQMVDMDMADADSLVGHAHHAVVKAPAEAGQHCDGCGQSSCDNGHACANCLAHCASALVASILMPASQSLSSPEFILKSWHFPSVHSDLLRPPRLS